MIVIFAAFKNEVKNLIRTIEPAGILERFISGKTDIYNGQLVINGDKQKAMICITGMGADKAVKSANNIISLGIKNSVFLVLGISGSTDEDIKSGDIVIYNKIINLDFLKRDDKNNFQFFADENAEKFKIKPENISEGFIDLNYHWQNDGYKVFINSGACVPFLVGMPKDKFDIGRNFDVAAIDMESYLIAKIAEENKIPFAIIRAISDDIFTEIPDYFKGFEIMSLINKLFLILKIVFSANKLRQIIKLLKGIKKAVNNLNYFALKEIIPFIHKKYFYKSKIN